MELSIRDETLSLLAHGPTSFAALYGFLVRGTDGQVDIEQTWREVEKLETAGLVEAFQMTSTSKFVPVQALDKRRAKERYRAWLGRLDAATLTVDATSVDDVGLWYTLTEAGRRAAASCAGDDRSWMIDYNDDGSIVVHAESDELAHRALDWWIENNPGMRMVGPRTTESVAAIRTRSGATIAPAVRLNALVQQVFVTKDDDGRKSK